MTPITTAAAEDVRRAYGTARQQLPNLTIIKTTTTLPHAWSIKLSRDQIFIDGTLPDDGWIVALRDALDALLRHYGGAHYPQLRLIPGGRTAEVHTDRTSTGTDGR